MKYFEFRNLDLEKQYRLANIIQAFSKIEIEKVTFKIGELIVEKNQKLSFD